MWRYILLILFLPILCAKRIESTEMSCSLLPGDLIWSLPLSPEKGDLVLLKDPLAPNRTIVRRVLAVEHDTFSYSRNGTPKINGKLLRQSELESLNNKVIIQESLWKEKSNNKYELSWQIQRAPQGISSAETSTIELKAGELFLLADDRDQQIDSRWWGTIQSSKTEGVIKMRVGQATPWRKWIHYYR